MEDKYDKMEVSQENDDSNKQCRVCSDVTSGFYFGALVCLPCKVSDYLIGFTL